MFCGAAAAATAVRPAASFPASAVSDRLIDAPPSRLPPPLARPNRRAFFAGTARANSRSFAAASLSESGSSAAAVVVGARAEFDETKAAVPKAQQEADAEDREVWEETAAAPVVAFDWRKHWYPVTFVEDFPAGVPVRFSLFDEPLVLWSAADGAIRCVADRCPHRAVPLSEGRVVPEGEPGAGTLECGYHGWQFNGAGECTRIPQLPAGVAVNGRRACAAAHAVAVRQGVVFVWGEAGAAGDESSIPTSELLERADMACVDVVRDLPYDYNVLVENILDPTHVPFAHHNTPQGNRYASGPLTLSFTERPGPDGRGLFKAAIAFGLQGRDRADSGNFLYFRPPVMGGYNYRFPFGEGGSVVYMVPLGHGRSRVLARFPRNFKKEELLRRPRFVDHMERNLLLDQDLVLLIEQEARLRPGGYDWRREWHMPAPCDAFVAAFRLWMESREVLDRYEQHVRLCSSCSAALRAIQLAQQGLAAAALALLASAALYGRVGPVPEAAAAAAPAFAAGATLLALACAAALPPLRALEKRFFYFPEGRDKSRLPATRKELSVVRARAAAAAKKQE
eukprot:tig00000889_g5288.t1